MKSNLTRHIRIHTVKNPPDKQIVPYVETQSPPINSQAAEYCTAQNARLKIYTAEKPVYKCNICERVLKSNHDLIVHTRIHTGEMPYKCSVCHKSFAVKSNLNRHTRIHTNEKLTETRTQYSSIQTGKIPCSVCGKVLINKNHFVFHVRSHTGEMVYSCEICAKSFAVKGNLTRHQRIHTGENHTLYLQKNDSLMHNLAHTDENLYHCYTCTKDFKRKKEFEKVF